MVKLAYSEAQTIGEIYVEEEGKAGTLEDKDL
jgi:hypothetical protein